MKFDAVMGHTAIAVVGIVGMVIVNVWGNESAALNAILGTAIGAGGWGAIQRQKEPVEKQ